MTRSNELNEVLQEQIQKENQNNIDIVTPYKKQLVQNYKIIIIYIYKKNI